MVFFESKDCSRKNAPLSSFKIKHNHEVADVFSSVPPWEEDLRRAVTEAGAKLKTTAVPKKPLARKSHSTKFHKRHSGVGKIGGHRMERHHLERCLW